MRAVLISLITLFSLAGFAHAEIQHETVSYKEGKTALEGLVYFDSTWSDKKPVILIIHQWMGITDNEKMRAEMLAKNGYVAFVVDIYGKDSKPKDQGEAGKLAGSFKGDPKLYRARIKAALDQVKKLPKSDAKKVVVSGYCFGGTGALEAARANFPILAAVSFHGGLSSPAPAAKAIKPKVLVLHGAVDPYVPQTEVDGFLKEMNGAKADYQFTAYSNAVHAFTQKEAGNDNSKGAAYNANADKRSWTAYLAFLNEVFNNG